MTFAMSPGYSNTTRSIRVGRAQNSRRLTIHRHAVSPDDFCFAMTNRPSEA